MAHSPHYEKIKTYFNNYLNHTKPAWTEAMVRNAAGRWLTAAEVDEILEGGVNG